MQFMLGRATLAGPPSGRGAYSTPRFFISDIALKRLRPHLVCQRQTSRIQKLVKNSYSHLPGRFQVAFKQSPQYGYLTMTYTTWPKCGISVSDLERNAGLGNQ